MPISLQMTFPNWLPLQAILGGLIQGTYEQFHTNIVQIGNVLEDALRMNAPVGPHFDLHGGMHPTEELRKSIKVGTRRQTSVASMLGVGIEHETLEITMAEHGKYTLPPGTKAHLIMPSGKTVVAPNVKIRSRGRLAPRVSLRRTRSLLAFYSPKTGRPVFLPQVHHPGYPGDAWDQRAYLMAQPEIDMIWQSTIAGWRIPFMRAQYSALSRM